MPRRPAPEAGGAAEPAGVGPVASGPEEVFGEVPAFLRAVAATGLPVSVGDARAPDHPLVFVNDAFRELTGHPYEGAVGRNARFLQGPGTDPARVAEMRRAIRGRRPLSVEVLNYRRDGTPFWNAMVLSPLAAGSDGEVSHFFAVHLDATASHEAETARRRARNMDALGRLMGGVAHDFNNLLTVVLGNLELARRARDGDRLGRHLARATEAAEHGARLTERLLSFARRRPADAAAGAPAGGTDLNGHVRRLGDLAARSLGAGIRLETSLAPDAPACRVDPGQLDLALLNLLMNARDAVAAAGREGGGRILVETRGRRLAGAGDDGPAGLPPGRYAAVAVSDDGTGMDAPTLERAGEPFFTTKAAGGGARGLGLAQVYGFARATGGRLRLASEPGRGTRAELLLPAAAVG